MNSTYLELVNRVCQRLNEQELTESNFRSVAGIHSTIRESVADAIETIIQEENKWPFMAVEHTIKLDPGTAEYAWPENFDAVDWESFFLIPNEENSLKGYHLAPTQKDRWYRYGREIDSRHLPEGVDKPTHVFQTHGLGFGLYPNPDKAYILKYRYWRTPKRLYNYNDECPIPSQYEYIIIACTLMLMSMFHDNLDQAGFWREKYTNYLKNVQRKYLNPDFKEMYDGRLRGR